MCDIEEVILSEILKDMADWPGARDCVVEELTLLGYSYYGKPDVVCAVLLMQQTIPDGSVERYVINLSNSYVNYFKRKIWFHTLITDGAASPVVLIYDPQDPAIERAIYARPYGPYDFRGSKSWKKGDV